MGLITLIFKKILTAGAGNYVSEAYTFPGMTEFISLPNGGALMGLGAVEGANHFSNRQLHSKKVFLHVFCWGWCQAN